MRRKDREVTDIGEIIEIMKQCDVCRLAFNDGEFPYILPLNFGMDYADEKITLYFHSALEGYKVNLIENCKGASFEMDTKHLLQYSKEKGHCTYAYESVIGRGQISIVQDGGKALALDKIMAHYHLGKDAPYNPAAIPRTLVYKLEVTDVTAKRKEPK